MRIPTTVLIRAAALSVVIHAGSAPAADLEEREQAARDATAAFLAELGSTLKKQLSEGGPAAALQVCSEAAPRIANRISLERGWRVTRVGTRVRNPMLGTPDAWEQQVLQDFATRGAQGERFAEMAHVEVVEEPAGRYFRFMKPIATQSVCLLCHGTADAMAPDVASTLEQLYPHDRARDYHEGELRGAVSIKQPM